MDANIVEYLHVLETVAVVDIHVDRGIVLAILERDDLTIRSQHVRKLIEPTEKMKVDAGGGI